MDLKLLSQSEYRPMPWQLQAWQQLRARLQSDRLPHALLISGAAGTGKQHFAQAFAALALCRKPENTHACGQCPACRQLAAGAHPDFHNVTILEDKNAILVDQIRELGQKLALTSQHRGWKIAVLSPADAMNSNAANSLLKTLEEPAAGTLLLLVTSRPAALAATIRSRCQAVRIGTPLADVAVQWLEARESRPDWPALLRIAGGGPLLAIELAKNSFVRERLRFYQKLVEMRGGRQDPVSYAAEAARENLPTVLRLLQTWIADLITLAATASIQQPGIINADALAMLQNALMGINLRGLHNFLSRINQALELSATSVNGQLLLEGLFMDWSEGLRSLDAAPLAATGE
jgi:DNA polymerase III subunit delta'